ncbi:hypothetical protein BZA05DRAFT_109733 [Tricharina praecox]|uniref:uncharacterized protein n=1 Tax=Tricharina praecox TaxID=43433 RepID=UPI00221F08AE|nr:uncharacterized protein BZA05DRAFT_477803 [Tricharina praecox]XP_051343656.1 uncharacterized protein BZA05DRAFT_109733 [Tricharina praecox]KAI5841284.1 hypothetical protein BZA05DRAFT_477803 [Tricharina praecox]KAI5857910.1 hypothetical protein BZA05DRAFT_109733 [Tricharina praecox]
MSTPVCKFFQRGTCNFGSQCKFIHPGQPTRGGNGGVPGQGQQYGGAPQNQQQQRENDGYNPATSETINIDLVEKPMWILSSYGPGKNPPVQLIDGKDISFEEARVLAYQCQAEGNPVAYEQQWVKLNTEADTQIRNIMSDLPGAVRFLTQAQENRDQLYKYRTPGGDPTGPISPFSQPQQQQQLNANQNPFGAPTQPAPAQGAFGQPAFGQSAFGQPSQPTISLTAPSPFAAASPTQPAFGQPAFGQTSAPQSAFGKPPQPAFGQPAFGQTSASQSAFGKPAFGQPAFGQSGFAAAQQPQQPQQPAQPQGVFGGASAFGKPAFGQPAFGQSAFGQPSALGAAPSPFAAAAAQNPAAASPFATAAAQPQNNGSPFAAATQNQPQNAGGPFGGFAQQAQQGGAPAAANPFGQPQGAQNAASPFSQVNPFQQTQQAQQANPAANPFGQPALLAAAAPTNAFATAPQQQSASPFSNANPFQSAGQPHQQQQPQTTPSAVNPIGQTAASAAGQKKWDDPVLEYTAEELAAFRAPEFKLGHVPLVAPPRELCL